MLLRQTFAQRQGDKKIERGPPVHAVGDAARMLTPRAKFRTGKLWMAESCEVRLRGLRGGRKRRHTLTLTLCGLLQCSLSTPSAVMLLGRITTSLLLSLHVSSHSSPECVWKREKGKCNETPYAHATFHPLKVPYYAKFNVC